MMAKISFTPPSAASILVCIQMPLMLFLTIRNATSDRLTDLSG